MSNVADWEEIRREILDKLDIEQEYRALGVRLKGEANHSGWISCHAFGRDDDSPSAGINVGSGKERGRYKDFGGNGDNLSFFDAWAKITNQGSWKDALSLYAKKAGVKLPKGKRPDNPRDWLDFKPWNANTVRIYCEEKGGITPRAVERVGGQIAKWKTGAIKEFWQEVLAFPVYQSAVLSNDPCGWVMVSTTGKMLEIYRGKARHSPDKKKVYTVGGSKSGLVNNWALNRLHSAEIIWKSEGITDCLALQSAIPDELQETHLVLTNSGGCQENVRTEYAQILAGKKVYILHDADEPGQTGAAKWAGQLINHTAEVRKVKLPYEIAPDHGKDVRDWLMEGHSYQELLAIAEMCPPLTKPATIKPGLGGVGCNGDGRNGDGHGGGGGGSGGGSGGHDEDEFLTNEQAILKELRLDVLGEHSGGEIDVYSSGRRKTFTIDRIAKFSYAELLQLCGDPAKDFAHEGKEDQPGKYRMNEIRNAIAFEGGKLCLSDHHPLGRGCWIIDGRMVLVDAGQAAIFDPKQNRLMTQEFPRVSNQILDFSAIERWCDFERLQNYLKLADHTWSQAVIEEARVLFARWYWTVPADALVTALLVACSWVQTGWPWRPLIFILGQSDAGKSTLFETVTKMFGHLGFCSSKPTEPGIRQYIWNTACICLVDEFEHDSHRQKILDLFRASSRGTKVVRGSSHQVKGGRIYGLKHIPWMAATESGLKKEPDRNRFIMLDLMRPPQGKRGKIAIPTDAALEDLGLKLLAVAIRYFDAAAAHANHMKGVQVPDIPGRVVESYATPAGLLAALRGQPVGAGGESSLLDLFVNRTVESQGLSDHEELMNDILASHVPLGAGKHASVSQIISNKTLYEESSHALERCGLILAGESKSKRDCLAFGQRRYLFFVPPVVQRFLLRNTRWVDMEINQIIGRYQGTKRETRKLGGKAQRGFLVAKDNLHLDEETAEQEPVQQDLEI